MYFYFLNIYSMQRRLYCVKLNKKVLLKLFLWKKAINLHIEILLDEKISTDELLEENCKKVKLQKREAFYVFVRLHSKTKIYSFKNRYILYTHNLSFYVRFIFIFKMTIFSYECMVRTNCYSRNARKLWMVSSFIAWQKR